MHVVCRGQGTAADGGHVYNLGSLNIGNSVNFRDGLAERNVSYSSN